MNDKTRIRYPWIKIKCFPAMHCLLGILILLSTVLKVSGIEFLASDDTFIDEQKPGKVHGKGNSLALQSNIKQVYLKFEVSGLENETIQRAKVQVHSSNVEGTISIYSVSDVNWSQDTLNWSNKPKPGKLLGTVNCRKGRVCEFDVTSVIRGNGTYAFCLKDYSGQKANTFTSVERNRNFSIEPTLSVDVKLDWQIVQTKFPTEDAVVAGVVLDASRLPSDPANQDCSPAIQRAMDLLVPGGGFVFLPPGEYRCDTPLKIPVDVCLRGDWGPLSDSDKSVRGAVIKVTYPGLDGQDKAFIEMDNRSGLQALSFWYPDQKLTEVIPYAATISTEEVKKEVLIKNIHLVNSYKGLDLNANMVRANINGIYGSPLKLGLYQFRSSDIPNYINIHFSADYWAQSGLRDAPSETDLTHYLRNNATGIRIAGSDNILADEWHVSDYKIGMHFVYAKNAGTLNGNVYGFSTENCGTGIQIDDIGTTFFVECHFRGDTAINIAKNSTKTKRAMLTFNGCVFESTVAAFDITDRRDIEQSFVLYQNCRFHKRITGGLNHLSVVDSDFLYKEAPPIQLEAGTPAAVFAGNRFAYPGFQGDPIDLNGADANRTEFSSDPTFSKKYTPFDVNGYDKVRKPTANNLIVMGTPKHSVNVDGVTDDAPAIQKALNEIATMGGGIVLLPQISRKGYAIRTPLNVPAGVELRSTNESHRSASPGRPIPGALLHIFHGRNDEQPTITLNEGSGLKGFCIHYPEQLASNITPYSYTIFSSGDNAYIQNMLSVNAYNFAHFKDSKNFLIENVLAYHMHNVYFIEGCLESRINRSNIRGEWHKDVFDSYDVEGSLGGFHLVNNIGYKVLNTDGLQIFSTFTRASHWAGHFINSSIHALQFKGEACHNGIMVDGIPQGKSVELIGTSIRVNRNISDKVICIEARGKANDGDLRIYSSLLNGYPDLLLGSKNLPCTLQQCHIQLSPYKSGNSGIRLDGQNPSTVRIENCALTEAFVPSHIANLPGNRLEMVGNIALETAFGFPEDSMLIQDSLSPQRLNRSTRLAEVANLGTPTLSAHLHEEKPYENGLKLLTNAYNRGKVEITDPEFIYFKGYIPDNLEKELLFEVTQDMFSQMNSKPEKVAVVVTFGGLESGQFHIEYKEPGKAWKRTKKIVLKGNVEQLGSKAMNVPAGVLKKGSQIRLVIESGNALFTQVKVKDITSALQKFPF